MTLPSSHEERDIMIRIHKVAGLSARIAEKALERKAQLTFAQFKILMALKHHGAISQKQVACYHGLTEAAVSRQIELLIRQKMIKRTVNTKNRREHMITLSPNGNRALEKALKVIAAQLKNVFAVFSPAERKTLKTALDKLFVSLEHYTPFEVHT